MNSIEDRLTGLREDNERLRRDLRRQSRMFRIAIGLSGVLTMAPFLSRWCREAAAESPQALLRAKRIEVVDGAGRVRVVVGELANQRHEGNDFPAGVGLAVFDDQGNQRGRLSAGEVSIASKEGLRLFDVEGKSRAIVTANVAGAAFRAEDGDGMFYMSGALLGNPLLQLGDQGSRALIDLGIRNGGGSLRLLKSNGDLGFKAP
ncbi:Hypothetical protein A7982_00756 [Minicystis rosea]|nr:Hypothetical protein A7982_00756 [Minicystis rosea]